MPTFPFLTAPVLPIRGDAIRHPRAHRVGLQLLVVWAVALVFAPSANAQMFGNVNTGEPLFSPFSRQMGRSSSPANASAVGQLQGNERFLRGNRSRRDFVGSDRNEQSGFVGAEQAIAVGRVRSATENLNIESVDARRVNRPIPPQPQRGLYYPRLEIAFEVPEVRAPRGPRAVDPPDAQMRERLSRVAESDLQLVLDDRTAIVEGTVDSQRKRDLIERILSFEPGVDVVDNRLKVR